MHKGVNLPTKTIVVEQLHMILVDFFRNLYSERSTAVFHIESKPGGFKQIRACTGTASTNRK